MWYAPEVAQPGVAHISENATQLSRRLVQNVALVVRGKEEVIELAVVSLLAHGHLLLEDVPGVGKTLRGRRLGLYGYGRIARAVAGYADAFGMQVVWWSSADGRARAAADVKRVAPSREAFFAESDVVSLHVRLKPETRGIIAAHDLAAMQPGALFVNTSRAGLIESGALLDALDAGRPGKAAIDVFDTEPLTDPGDPLLSHPNLLATPHIGFVTEDEFDLQFSDIFDQVNAFADGAPIHTINPEVWSA